MDLEERKAELVADVQSLEHRFNVTQENAKQLTVDIHRLSGAIAMLDEQLAAANGNTAEVVAE
mgnify:FL=1